MPPAKAAETRIAAGALAVCLRRWGTDPRAELDGLDALGGAAGLDASGSMPRAPCLGSPPAERWAKSKARAKAKLRARAPALKDWKVRMLAEHIEFKHLVGGLGRSPAETIEEWCDQWAADEAAAAAFCLL